LQRPHTGLTALLLTSGQLFGPVYSAAAEPKPAPIAAPQIHTILINGLQFMPAELQVHVGDAVIWTNADIVPHTILASKSFDSKNLGPGQSWQWVPRRTGRFNYACAYHPTMLGTLSVQ